MMKQLLGLSLAITTAIAFAPSVQARSLPGYGGHSWIATESGCFSDLWGSANQNCAGAHNWFIALPTDQGWWSPDIIITAPAGTVVTCDNYGVDPSLFPIWHTSIPSNSVGGTQRLTPGAVNVPNDGHLFVLCNIPQGARVHNVNW
jgi:hypothetical protein